MNDNVFSFIHKFLRNNYKLLFPGKEGDVFLISGWLSGSFSLVYTEGCNAVRKTIMELSQSSGDCYNIYLYNNDPCRPTAYLDFNKKLIAYGDKESLTANEKEFFTALEMELKGDEYVSEFNKEYKGVLPETIYRFDVGHFELGALIQIHVLKDESILYGKDRFKAYGWEAGYRYNAMVITYENNKTLLHLYAKTKENSLSSIKEVVISAEEVEKGLVKLIRVG
jgi:hypothetical protein